MKCECPKCGFSLQPKPFLRCPSCGAALVADAAAIHEALAFAPEIDEANVLPYIRKDCEIIGAQEKISLKKTLPCLLPFWGVQGEGILRAASDVFPEEKIAFPSRDAIVFQPPDASIPLGETDRAHVSEAGELLYYVPFFQVTLFHGGKEYRYFVDRISGRVHGPPILSAKIKATRSRLIRFFLIFVLFIAANLTAPTLPWMFLANTILVIAVHFLWVTFSKRKSPSP